jgi:hypothetical protein
MINNTSTNEAHYFTQKHLNQMMYKLDILAFGVVRARSAHTGPVSALLVQSKP